MAGPSPRVPDRDRQILQAAAELFYERGFHGVGVVEIGARIGISGPAIYRHFSGKDEILSRLFNEAMDEVTQPSAAHEDPRAELQLLVERHIAFALGHRELLSIFTHEERSLTAPLRKRFRTRMRQHARRWETVLARCYPDADGQDVAVAAQAAIGLIHSTAFWPHGPMRTEALPEMLTRLVLGGLDALAPATR